MNKRGKRTRLENVVFLLFLVFLAVLFSYMVALFLQIKASRITDFIVTASYYLSYINPILFLLYNAGAMLVSFFGINAVRREYYAQKDEIDYVSIEPKIRLPYLLSRDSLYINFVFFSLSINFFYLDIFEQNEASRRLYVLFAVFSLVLGFLWVSVIQNSCMKMYQKLNPGKEGDILDLNFSKEWEQGEDEAQKAKRYRSGYIAFKSTSKMCFILWVASFFAKLLFNVPSAFSICIGLVLAFMNIVYFSQITK